MDPIKFMLLSEDAKCPVRNEGDAGYDLFSPVNLLVPAGNHELVKTNISMKLPELDGIFDLYGRVCPRSGLSLKKAIGIGGGVIDKSYSGDIGVIIINHGFEAFQILKGDRIAQLVIEVIATPKIIVSEFDSEFSRGSRGFGSSGR